MGRTGVSNEKVGSGVIPLLLDTAGPDPRLQFFTPWGTNATMTRSRTCGRVRSWALRLPPLAHSAIPSSCELDIREPGMIAGSR